MSLQSIIGATDRRAAAVTLQIPCFTGLSSINAGCDLRIFATISTAGATIVALGERFCSTGASGRHAPPYGNDTNFFVPAFPRKINRTHRPSNKEKADNGNHHNTTQNKRRTELHRPDAEKEVREGYLFEGGNLFAAQACRRVGRSAATVNNYMQHLHGLFAVAGSAYETPLKYEDMQSAMRTLRRLSIVGKANKRDRRPTVEELNDLMEEAFARSVRSNAAPLHKIIAFAIASSRRLSEITRLRWADINYKDKKILVRDMKHPGQTKGNDVWVLLSDEALQIIMSMPAVDEKIFPYVSASLSIAFTRLVKVMRILRICAFMIFDTKRYLEPSRWDGQRQKCA